MRDLRLNRADRTNGWFHKLEAQWRLEAESAGDSYDDFASPFMEHARRISAETPDPKYGIHVLCDGDTCVGLAHLNTARLRGTVGLTLRVVWVLLSPRFDYQDVAPSDLAAVASGLIMGALELSSGPMRSDHVKVHLANIPDRQFFAGVAEGLKGAKLLEIVEIRGNWLHMSKAALPQADIDSNH